MQGGPWHEESVRAGEKSCLQHLHQREQPNLVSAVPSACLRPRSAVLASRETEMIIIMIFIILPPTHFGLVTALCGWRKQDPHPLPPPDAAVKMRLGTE